MHHEMISSLKHRHLVLVLLLLVVSGITSAYLFSIDQDDWADKPVQVSLNRTARALEDACGHRYSMALLFAPSLVFGIVFRPTPNVSPRDATAVWQQVDLSELHVFRL
jgi:NADH:ubiquinone oxidoreductase subunit 5 (subunit L)/multisubunit Na+/H+ antiporter MnhA subunit